LADVVDYGQKFSQPKIPKRIAVGCDGTPHNSKPVVLNGGVEGAVIFFKLGDEK